MQATRVFLYFCIFVYKKFTLTTLIPLPNVAFNGLKMECKHYSLWGECIMPSEIHNRLVPLAFPPLGDTRPELDQLQ